MKFVLIPVLILFSFVADAQSNYSERSFFRAMATEDLDVVDQELLTLSKTSLKDKEAYEGTLLMKKAGLSMRPRTKLNSFKDGHTKLERAITKDPSNATYRFLRLIIQENAPGILNYNDNIEADSKMINEAFTSLSEVVQREILDYEKKSKMLRISATAAVIR